jgi:hypothetical protein
MKKCPTCGNTFDDSMKFCQTDGTPLVDTVEAAGGGDLPNDADSTKTKIMSAEEMEKELGWGAMKSETPGDNAPPSPFDSSSAPSWMDSPDKGLDDFSPTPSPFDEAKSSNYRSPSSPFQEPEPMFGKPQESFNQSPFGNPPPFGNQAEPYNPPPFQQTEWTPPPAPVSEWQNQNIGQNTAFQPPINQSQNQTLPIISLACGVLAFVLTCCYGGIPLGLAALITGFLGMQNVNKDPENYSGKTLAIVGMIFGGIGLVLSLIMIIFGIAMNSFGGFPR